MENNSPPQSGKPGKPPGACSTITLAELSNEEFLQSYAKPGRIGLSGGRTWIDKMITRAERHLDEKELWGRWSHAFVFEGSRIDGQQWVIESDLHLERKHIVMGAQENRITKYYNEELYSSLAILDFGLTDIQSCMLLREGLDLVASRNRYSLRELVGTLIALRKPSLRAEENLLARKRSMYCSAFVQHLFRNIKIDLAPGVHSKNTTPEDIWRSSLPHVSYVLERSNLRSSIEKGRVRLRRRLKARVKSFRSKGKAST